MLIDLRRCVGCQACTVACTIENQPPLGQFRTTVSQYEVSDVAALEAPASLLMLPRLCNHCVEPACLDVCPTGATFQRIGGDGKALGAQAVAHDIAQVTHRIRIALDGGGAFVAVENLAQGTGLGQIARLDHH